MHPPVIPAPAPEIHVLGSVAVLKTWVAGTSPTMTRER